MSEIFTIDCKYVFPRFAAAFLIKEKKTAAFIETNTSHSVPILLEELSKQGLAVDDVKYIMITHVHLDHAGGTSRLMEACPKAQLLCHPNAAVHMRDPSKLIASAREVYGDKIYEKLYGQIGPIHPSRIREVGDGEEIPFGSTVLRFIHTKGHANHHFCVYDRGSNSIFTGDSFGLAYPDLQRNGTFVFPSTSPTGFDAKEAILSVKKILQSGASQAYLTHFGKLTELEEAARQLQNELDFSKALMEKAAELPDSGSKLNEFCEKELIAHFESLMKRKGLTSKEDWELVKMDVQLNAAGIAFTAQRKRKSEKS